MDTQRIGSCLTSRSMSTKDICILMVHNDPMYHNIMLEVLENSNHHEVMRCQRTADALNRIQERKEQLSIVITDIHRSYSNGFEILNHIEKEFKLPVISMNPHQNAGAVTVRLDREAKLYIMKSLSVSEFETHWDHAYTKQRGKTNFQNVSVLQERETRTGSQIESPIHVVIQEDQKDKKRKSKEIYEQSEEDNYDIPNEKKSRIMWSEAMHHKFVQVVEFLGLHRALPEKILELMNVPSLTRENVASHLQKYQICLKRAKEERKSTRSVFSINSTPLRFCQSNYSDSPSPVTKHIPYHTQESTLMSYQPGLGPFNFPDYSGEISRSTSNHGIQQFSYSSSSLFSNTQTNTRPINTNTSVPNIFSNHPETSTTTSNSSPQNLVTINNNHVNRIFPNTQNSHLTDTTQIYSSPFTNEIPQPDSSNNIEYVGLRVTTNGELVDCDQTSAQNNTSSTDIADLLNQSNRNESLVQFPSNTQNSHLTDTTQIYSSPFTNEIPQPDSSNNIEYVGLRVTTNGELVDCDQTSAQNNTSSTDIADLLNQSNRNESLVQFPSNTQNFHLTDTTQIYSSPFTNEIPQPDSSNNIEYVGLRVTTNGELVDCDQTSAQNNTSSTDIADLLNQSNRNESLVQFPSTQMDHNSEQEYPISTFEWDAEGYFI